MRGVLLISLLVPSLVAADPGDDRAADHTALRQLMAETAQALTTRDATALERLLTPGCSVTVVEQERCDGVRGVLAAYDRWCGAEGPLASVSYDPVPDGPARFLAEGVAMATGTSSDRYRLKDGSEIAIPQRWTAIAVRDAGAWRVAALHSGVRLMDNPVLEQTASAGRRLAVLTAVTGLAAGLLVGWLIGRRR